MKNELLDKGIILPSGEIGKDSSMSLSIKSLSMSVTAKDARTPRRRLKSTSILWADTYPPLSGKQN